MVKERVETNIIMKPKVEAIILSFVLTLSDSLSSPRTCEPQVMVKDRFRENEEGERIVIKNGIKKITVSGKRKKEKKNRNKSERAKEERRKGNDVK